MAHTAFGRSVLSSQPCGFPLYHVKVVQRTSIRGFSAFKPGDALSPPSSPKELTRATNGAYINNFSMTKFVAAFVTNFGRDATPCLLQQKFPAGQYCLSRTKSPSWFYSLLVFLSFWRKYLRRESLVKMGHYLVDVYEIPS